MKFMKTVNELQAVVKKLITEMQVDYAGRAGQRICDKCGGRFGLDCYHMGISKPAPELKSSEEWAEIYKNKFKVLDPDGWDRSNFSKSWAEPITEEEFNLRAAKSTCEGFSPTPDLPLHVKVARDLRKIADALEKEETHGKM